MKKILFLMAAMVLAVVGAQAQCTFESYNPDLTFTVERCVANGNKATITMRVTNVGQKDLEMNLWPKEAYDDEANMYTSQSDNYVRIVNNYGTEDTCYIFNLPSETSVRFSLTVNGLSRAATEFIRLNIYEGCGNGMVKIKHVPISR